MSVRRVLGVAAVLAVTGAALATNTKIKAFSAQGAGANPLSCYYAPNVDGMAIFKDRIVDGTAGSELHLHLQDLQPGQCYNVAVYSTGSEEPDAYTFHDTFTTNASGNATIELWLPTWDSLSLSDHPRIQIYKDDGAADNTVTNTELIAEGMAN